MPARKRNRRLAAGACVPQQAAWSTMQAVTVVVIVVIATIALAGTMSEAGIPVADTAGLLSAAAAIAVILRRPGQ